MKTLLLSVLISSSTCFFAQTTTKSFQVVSKSHNFTSESKLENLDPFMMDLYRSKTVDNTINLTIGDQTVSFVLLSANTLDSLGIAYDKGLVEKGAKISGTAANFQRTFSWRLEENNAIKDLTTY